MVVSSAHPLDSGQSAGIPAGIGVEACPDRRKERLFFLVRGRCDAGPLVLRLHAEHHEQGSVSAVVEDHVCASTLAPVEDPVREVPVLGEALPLEGENRNAAGGNRRGRVILSREDIAGGPAHLGPEDDECLDEHRGLNRHVEGPRDARPLERPVLGVLLAHRHQPRHLVLGDAYLLAPPLGLAEVGHVVVLCSLCSSHAPLHSREAGS